VVRASARRHIQARIHRREEHHISFVALELDGIAAEKLTALVLFWQ